MDLVGRYADISIHVPAWGTTKSAHADLVNNKFQSTFPRGERPFLPLLQLQLHNFNPRSRVGNDRERKAPCKVSGNFNPRSRVGNDLRHPVHLCNTHISIHVPAWGTTHIHLPRLSRNFYFNPRSRVGNDIIGVVIGAVTGISIHVPAWGTTRFFNTLAMNL